MTKFMRSRHVPLKLEEPESVKEEFDDFLTDAKEVGAILKTLREKKGWSESDLASQVGVESERIQMMESGKQPVPLIVAKVFGKLFNRDYHLFL